MFNESQSRHRVDVDGHDISYIDVGSGPVTFLLHGAGPGSSGISNFRRNVEALSRNRRLIIPDFPGFGASSNKPFPPTEGLFGGMGRMVLGVMDALGIERAHLVGNSLGGGAALMAALAAPDRIGRLVLMGPGGILPVFTPFPTAPLMRLFSFYGEAQPTADHMRTALQQLVFDPASVTEELVQERLANSLRPEIMRQPPVQGRIPEEIWREPIGKLAHPTLLVWGREDRVIPMDAAFIALKAMPNARLHVLPRCGHWAQWERADEFNPLVDQFLAGPP